MPGPPLIEARGLTRRFGDLVVVDRVSLAVHAGEIVGLVGPDGAGKTTILRMLAGLLDPSEGECRVAGFDLATHLDQAKDQLGYMAQRFGLYPDLTVEENMHFYAELFGISPEERERVGQELLQMTRLEPFRQRAAGKLSGGMKQKLALICALLHRPRVLLLDEPTTGVDPVSRRDFWRILRRLASEQIAILVTTAYLEEAELCDRVGLLYRGKLIRLASPAQLRAEFRERGWKVRRVGTQEPVHPEEPSMEDIFMGFVEAQEQAGAGGAV